MKLTGILLVAMVALSSCGKVPYSGKYTLKNSVDSVSYALGYIEAGQLIQMMERTPFDSIDRKKMAALFVKSDFSERYAEYRKQQFDSINFEAFRYGMTHQLRFNKAYFDEMSADVVLRAQYDKIMQRKNSEKATNSKVQLEAGKKFLAENGARAGVVTTPSGLQYEVVTTGTGAKPVLTDRVKCHYHGTLTDGTVFDSSVERKEPATFGVSGVIKGWTEALQMMPVGSKWKLYVPYELAYGENGAGDKILPYSTLIFEVEVLEIVK